MTFQEFDRLLDSSLVGWRRLYQPWIVAHLVLVNGSASIGELCDAYPRCLSAWDSEQARLAPEQRIQPAVRTLEKRGIVEYDTAGHVVLNCTLALMERLLVIDKCLSKSVDGTSLRDCLRRERIRASH
jgi:hypothetical protein